MRKYRLTKEENEILDAVENDQWELVKPRRAEPEYYAKIARNTFRKEFRKRDPSSAAAPRLKRMAGDCWMAWGGALARPAVEEIRGIGYICSSLYTKVNVTDK